MGRAQRVGTAAYILSPRCEGRYAATRRQAAQARPASTVSRRVPARRRTHAREVRRVLRWRSLILSSCTHVSILFARPPVIRKTNNTAPSGALTRSGLSHAEADSTPVYSRRANTKEARYVRANAARKREKAGSRRCASSTSSSSSSSESEEEPETPSNVPQPSSANKKVDRERVQRAQAAQRRLVSSGSAGVLFLQDDSETDGAPLLLTAEDQKMKAHLDEKAFKTYVQVKYGRGNEPTAASLSKKRKASASSRNESDTEEEDLPSLNDVLENRSSPASKTAKQRKPVKQTAAKTVDVSDIFAVFPVIDPRAASERRKRREAASDPDTDDFTSDEDDPPELDEATAKKLKREKKKFDELHKQAYERKNVSSLSASLKSRAADDRTRIAEGSLLSRARILAF